MRHANEFPVRKHGAGAFVAVVQHHVHTSCQQLRIQRVGCGFDIGEAVGTDGAQHHGKWRQRVRPNNTARIVVLLNRRGGKARDTDAVAAHFHRLGLTVHIQERRVHGLAVLGAQIEDVADLNAALNR